MSEVKRLSYSEFRKYLEGEFRQDERLIELQKRLGDYYTKAEISGDRQAAILYREFKTWSDALGYTAEEISIAKRTAAAKGV